MKLTQSTFNQHDYLILQRHESVTKRIPCDMNAEEFFPISCQAFLSLIRWNTNMNKKSIFCELMLQSQKATIM